MWNPFNKAARPAPKEDAPVSATAENDAARVERLMKMISAADTGAQLAGFLQKNGIAVRFVDALQGGDTVGTCVLNTERIEEQSPWRFRLAKPVINLLRSASDAKAAMALLHEGRHAMQAESGLHPLTRYLSQEDTKSYIRMVEADAGSFAILTGMKIFMATGDAAIVTEAIRTKADDECVAKLMKLATEYGANVADEPIAQRALFDAWFRDEKQVARYDAYGEACWTNISAAVRDSLGHTPSPPPLNREDILGLGTLTHTENYLTVEGLPDVAETCGFTAPSVRKASAAPDFAPK
jgi:hypothetical protein